MQRHAALTLIAPYALLAVLASACGASPNVSTPVLQTETFTGTLQPLGVDFKTFTIAYAISTSDLSVTVNSLRTVNGATPVTGITIGLGLGAPSGANCALHLQTPLATLGSELFAPNGASAGNYCVQISDCPTGATGCASTLAEAVTYTMTVKHY
jgi:hypothetical protein